MKKRIEKRMLRIQLFDINSRLDNPISTGEPFPRNVQTYEAPLMSVQQIEAQPMRPSIPLETNTNLEFQSMVFQDGQRRYPTADKIPTSDPILSAPAERERLQRAFDQSATRARRDRTDKASVDQAKSLQAILDPNGDVRRRLEAVYDLIRDGNTDILKQLADDGLLNRELLAGIIDELEAGSVVPKTFVDSDTMAKAAAQVQKQIDTGKILNFMFSDPGKIVSGFLYDDTKNEFEVPAGQRLVDFTKARVDDYSRLASTLGSINIAFADPTDATRALNDLATPVGSKISQARALAYTLLKFQQDAGKLPNLTEVAQIDDSLSKIWKAVPGRSNSKYVDVVKLVDDAFKDGSILSGWSAPKKKK